MVDKHNIKKAINILIREKGRFPNEQEMCNLLNFSPEQTRKYMEVLVEDGFIRKVGDWFSFPLKEIKEEEEINKTKEIKVEKKYVKNTIPVFIIQLFMGIIGTGATIISIYYTTVFLNEFLPWIFSLMLSSIMILFSISSFETIILFFSQNIIKNLFVKHITTLIFILLWLVVTSFSIMSTVAGQYNKHIENINNDLEKDKNSIEWASLIEQEKELKENLNNYREQIKSYNSIVSGINDLEERKENSKIWADTQYRIRITNKQINEAMENLKKIRENKKKHLQTSKNIVYISIERNLNFYEWIAKIFNISKDIVQFIMSLFPAVFCDFIAPIGLALCLFLNKDKGELNER